MTDEGSSPLNVMTNESAERQKAASRPIDGNYVEFAKQVRYLLGWDPSSNRPFISSRVANRKTGVSYQTITTMARGDRPKADTIQKFAEGMGEDPKRLLQLAGYLSEDNETPGDASSLIDYGLLNADRYLAILKINQDDIAYLVTKSLWKVDTQWVLQPPTESEDARRYNQRLLSMVENWNNAVKQLSAEIQQGVQEAVEIDQLFLEGMKLWTQWVASTNEDLLRSSKDSVYDLFGSEAFSPLDENLNLELLRRIHSVMDDANRKFQERYGIVAIKDLETEDADWNPKSIVFAWEGGNFIAPSEGTDETDWIELYSQIYDEDYLTYLLEYNLDQSTYDAVIDQEIASSIETYNLFEVLLDDAIISSLIDLYLHGNFSSDEIVSDFMNKRETVISFVVTNVQLRSICDKLQSNDESRDAQDLKYDMNAYYSKSIMLSRQIFLDLWEWFVRQQFGNEKMSEYTDWVIRLLCHDDKDFNSEVSKLPANSRTKAITTLRDAMRRQHFKGYGRGRPNSFISRLAEAVRKSDPEASRIAAQLFSVCTILLQQTVDASLLNPKIRTWNLSLNILIDVIIEEIYDWHRRAYPPVGSDLQ